MKKWLITLKRRHSVPILYMILLVFCFSLVYHSDHHCTSGTASIAITGEMLIKVVAELDKESILMVNMPFLCSSLLLL